MPFLKALPNGALPEAVLSKFPDTGQLFLQLTQQLLRSPSMLTTGERELIAAFTSGLNTCQFCYEGHSVTAEALGVDPGLVERLVEDIDTSGCEEKLKPLLHYIKKLTTEPYKIIQSDVDAIFAVRWNEEAFYTATSICGLFNYYNRLVQGYGIEAPPNFKEMLGDYLAVNGYLHDHE